MDIYTIWTKKRVEIQLNTEQKMKQKHRIVMLTDLHLGYHNRANEFRKWIDTVNKEQPEAVLIGGDIIDRSIRAINEQKYGSRV